MFSPFFTFPRCLFAIQRSISRIILAAIALKYFSFQFKFSSIVLAKFKLIIKISTAAYYRCGTVTAVSAVLGGLLHSFLQRSLES